MTYGFGEDTTDTLAEARADVQSFLENELDNGPGWLVKKLSPDGFEVDGGDIWEVKLSVTLVKKPPRRTLRDDYEHAAP